MLLCYETGDIGAAKECFTRAYEALCAIDDNVVSHVESRNAKCVAQARAELGIVQCQSRAIPEYTWRRENGDLDGESDGAARQAWAGLLEYLDDSLQCCEGYEGDESGGLLEVKACAMLWRARSLDGVFEYDCVSGLGGGEEDYYGCDENVQHPDFE